MSKINVINRVSVRPFVSKETAINFAEKIFGLQVSKIKELDSYDDRNFYMEGILPSRQTALDAKIDHDGPNSPGDENEKEHKLQKFIFKVMHSRDTYASGSLDAIESAMQHLDAAIGHVIAVPVNLPTLSGVLKVLVDMEIPEDLPERRDPTFVEKIKECCKNGDRFLQVVDNDGRSVITLKHYVRLLSYVPGDVVTAAELENDIIFQAGQLAARVVTAFKDFTRPGLVEKKTIWDMKNCMQLRSSMYLDTIQDPLKRRMAETGLDMFEKNFMPIIPQLPSQTIHSDLNEQNLLMQKSNGKKRITGLIDFGDMVSSCRVFEVSTCMMYLSLLNPDDCIEIAGSVLAGYLSESMLTQCEFDALYYCVIGRLLMSLILGSYQYSKLDTGNDYLMITSKPGWTVLATLLQYQHSRKDILKGWLNFCSAEAQEFYIV